MKITIIILVIAALVAAIAFFLLGRKKQEGKKAYKPGNSVFSQKNIIDKADKIVFTDVVAYFKGLSLIKGQDTPFIAKANAEELKPTIEAITKIEEEGTPSKENGEPSLEENPVYTSKDFNDTTLFLGTLNEKNGEVENVKIIIAESFDEKTKDVLGNESLVVLN